MTERLTGNFTMLPLEQINLSICKGRTDRTHEPFDAIQYEVLRT